MEEKNRDVISKNHYSIYFIIIVAIFITSLITANIIAVKLVDLFGFVVPAAIIIFPISYIVGDVLTEVYGYSRARQVIWLGFICNFLAVVAITIGGLLPPASFWDGQMAYERILGYTPRLLVASFVAYLFGEFLNSYFMARMKVLTKGKYLWIRTIGSTLLGQGVDSLIFITIAFIGTIPGPGLITAIITQWLFKSVYEIIATPLTYRVIGYLKHVENQDLFDTETDFNPLKFLK
ncbi:queuosine precursor transporter [Chloroflexota bacterium]